MSVQDVLLEVPSGRGRLADCWLMLSPSRDPLVVNMGRYVVVFTNRRDVIYDVIVFSDKQGTCFTRASRPIAPCVLIHVVAREVSSNGEILRQKAEEDLVAAVGLKGAVEGSDDPNRVVKVDSVEDELR